MKNLTLNTIGNALQNTWASAQQKNTWDGWNEAYLTIRGMWLMCLHGGMVGETAWEYTDMLMQIAQINRTQTCLD
jgi:hypothetical protein